MCVVAPKAARLSLSPVFLCIKLCYSFDLEPIKQVMINDNENTPFSHRAL